MKLAEREAQIIRIQADPSESDFVRELHETLRREVLLMSQSVIESALVEELLAERQRTPGTVARRSGYFSRTLDTEYGRITHLRVPKVRWGNKARDWQILTRYQRGWDSLLHFSLCLYVMGLSFRDLQEALYPILGSVLSLSAINRITLEAQHRMNTHRQTPIEHTPPILIVDGVWVDIQYAQGGTKIDRAGHQRQVRQAEERVVLAAMAVWPDGTYHILHYEIAHQEDIASWEGLFEHLIERGLDPNAVKLVVSDGSLGLPTAMSRCLPNAKQQRCTTHKVRGIKRYLSYENLADSDEQGHSISVSEAKQQRRFEIQSDAYAIYNCASYDEAQIQLEQFVKKWQPIEAKAVETFLKDIQLTFSFYDFELGLHPRIRTSNLLERLFEEFRRKSDEIGAFPNEYSCLTVFFLVVQRDHVKHERSMMAKT